MSSPGTGVQHFASRTSTSATPCTTIPSESEPTVVFAFGAFSVKIAVDSFDRPRLLEDVARSFAEHGANILSYGGVVEDGMARNWYTAEVGDVKELRALMGVLRNLEGVFDAYRMTPS